MSVSLRLSRGGSKKRPFFRIVAADIRAPRDGRYIERLGTYNPMREKNDPERINLNLDRIKYWLSVGAKPTDRVNGFLAKEGLLKKVPVPKQTKQDKPRKKTIEKLKAKEEKLKAKKEMEKAAENVPEAPAQDTKPTTDEKPVEEAKSAEATQPSPEEKPVEEAKPAEATQPSPEEKPVEETKPAEATQPSPEEKPVEEAKPAEATQPSPEEKPVEEAKPAEATQPSPEEKPGDENKA